MNRTLPGLLLLAGLIAFGCTIAGCIDTPGATPENITPPAGEETPASDPGDVAAGNTRFALDLYHRLADDPKYVG
ncbi:MAG: serpin family protein, partial [Methanomicrobiales archaeon]|nr:serpin family protein [Methanomicrobiales archaeon]